MGWAATSDLRRHPTEPRVASQGPRRWVYGFSMFFWVLGRPAEPLRMEILFLQYVFFAQTHRIAAVRVSGSFDPKFVGPKGVGPF